MCGICIIWGELYRVNPGERKCEIEGETLSLSRRRIAMYFTLASHLPAIRRRTCDNIGLYIGHTTLYQCFLHLPPCISHIMEFERTNDGLSFIMAWVDEFDPLEFFIHTQCHIHQRASTKNCAREPCYFSHPEEVHSVKHCTRLSTEHNYHIQQMTF